MRRYSYLFTLFVVALFTLLVSSCEEDIIIVEHDTFWISALKESGNDLMWKVANPKCAYAYSWTMDEKTDKVVYGHIVVSCITDKVAAEIEKKYREGFDDMHFDPVNCERNIITAIVVLDSTDVDAKGVRQVYENCRQRTEKREY